VDALVGQGNPLAPAGYTLALESAHRVGGPLTAGTAARRSGFYDDNAIAGSAADVSLVLARLNARGARVGQRLAPSKTAAVARDHATRQEVLQARIVDTVAAVVTGADFLGIPVGDAEHCSQAVLVRATSLLEGIGQLRAPLGPQGELYLTRIALGTPALVNLLRALPVSVTQRGCAALDEAVRCALVRITVLPTAGFASAAAVLLAASPLTPLIQLPMRFGGLHLGGAQATAPAARLAGQAVLARAGGRLEGRTLRWEVASGSARCTTSGCHGARCALGHDRCIVCCLVALEGPCEDCASRADDAVAADGDLSKLELVADLEAFGAAADLEAGDALRVVAVARRYRRAQTVLASAVAARVRSRVGGRIAAGSAAAVAFGAGPTVVSRAPFAAPPVGKWAIGSDEVASAPVRGTATRARARVAGTPACSTTRSLR